MPRRQKKQSPNPKVFPGVLFVVICLLVLNSVRVEDVAPFIALLLMLGLFGIVIVIAISRARRGAVEEIVNAIVEKHIDALVRQRTIQVRSDPYGKPMLEKWHGELQYFITHHVRPAINPSQLPFFDRQRANFFEHIRERVAQAAEQRPAVRLSPEMTPAEFEVFCAEQLRNCGWEVQVTPLCKDQGVDVIAVKNGIRVVLQCKLYSKPVGNKAVQEIAAGKIHQQAVYGAVVTNSTFTSSAKQPASTTGIRLLHHTDLLKLDMILGEAGAPYRIPHNLNEHRPGEAPAAGND